MVSFKSLASAAAVGLFSFASAQDWSVGQPRENCDVPDYAQIQGAGGGDGNAFCGSKFKEGILIKKIEVQGHYEIIRGITVTYTDDTYDTFGRMDFEDADESRRAELEFDPTVDTVTKAEIWPNGWNAHGNEGVASLVFETSNDGTIDVKNDWDHEIVPTVLDVGNAGMLLGIAGRCGESIDRLDFIFTKEKIKKRSVEDMTLTPDIDEINLRQSNKERGFVVEYLDEIHHVNNLNTPTDIWLRGEKKVSTSTSITKTSSDTFHLGMGFEFKAKMGILIAESELTTKTDMFWEHTDTTSNTETTTEEVTKAWQQIATAEPGTAIRCYAWTFEASTTDIAWEGTIRLVFEDDTVMEYPSSGAYNTAQYSRVNTHCEQEDPEDALKAFSKGVTVYEDGELLTKRTIGERSKAKALRK